MYRRLRDVLDLKSDPALAQDPVIWVKRALSAAHSALAPIDVKNLNLAYECDAHWYGQGFKLINLALKAQERGEV